MNLSEIPDVYYTRVVFELEQSNQDNQECIDKFIESYDMLIKNKCNLNKKYFQNDYNICGTTNQDLKCISNPYDTSYSGETGNYIRIQIRFYNTINEKWTFEELNNFIKMFVKISSEYINTDYMRSFIELELENF